MKRIGYPTVFTQPSLAYFRLINLAKRSLINQVDNDQLRTLGPYINNGTKQSHMLRVLQTSEITLESS